MAPGTADDLISVLLIPAAGVLKDVLVRYLSLFIHQILCRNGATCQIVWQRLHLRLPLVLAVDRRREMQRSATIPRRVVLVRVREFLAQRSLTPVRSAVPPGNTKLLYRFRCPRPNSRLPVPLSLSGHTLCVPGLIAYWCAGRQPTR